MTGLRARVRAELTAEITAIARRQVATEGAGNLSLRAIAREMGMASSAIYRYFSSRDELLTALIVESYNELGVAAEAADATCARSEVMHRWLAVSRAAYDWATANPAEYALLFGTPVPGYAAPPDTIGPANRFTLVLAGLLDEADRQGLHPAVPAVVDPAMHHDFERLREMTATAAGDDAFVAGMQAWTALFGAISFIIFGQLNNVITDHDEFFGVLADLIGRQVFAAPARPRS